MSRHDILCSHIKLFKPGELERVCFYTAVINCSVLLNIVLEGKSFKGFYTQSPRFFHRDVKGFAYRMASHSQISVLEILGRNIDLNKYGNVGVGRCQYMYSLGIGGGFNLFHARIFGLS